MAAATGKMQISASTASAVPAVQTPSYNNWLKGLVCKAVVVKQQAGVCCMQVTPWVA
jgi:hypothetical protein